MLVLILVFIFYCALSVFNVVNSQTDQTLNLVYDSVASTLDIKKSAILEDF